MKSSIILMILVSFIFISFSNSIAQNRTDVPGVPKSGIKISGVAFKPRDNDEIIFTGLKMGYGMNNSTQTMFGLFIDLKYDEHQLYSSKLVKLYLFSVGGEYCYYFTSQRNLYFGTEFFYSILSEKFGSGSNSTEGFGFSPKMGIGGFSAKTYLFIEVKYNMIEFDSDFNGIGVELGAVFGL